MLDEFQRQADAGNQTDYLSNTITRTFPRGLDAEIFNFGALEVAANEAAESYEREHVTPFIYRHPKRFRLRSFESRPDLSALRWTLDTPEDWHFIRQVYEALSRPNELFGTKDVLELLQRKPELALVNSHVEQKKPGD
jgi:spore coat polysaccharide biosynthesis protein SpsF